MAITSIGYAGSVNESAWAKLAATLGSTYGVYGPGDWVVTKDPTGDRTVKIATGSGHGRGVFDTSDAITSVQLAAITSGTRWDLVCVRRDWQTGVKATTFTTVAGTAAQQIPVTRLNDPGMQDDQPLALVQLTAGQSVPTAVVDLRCWSANGGLVAVDSLALGYLTDIGTRVRVGAGEYMRTLDSAGNPAWVFQSLAGLDASVITTGNLAPGRMPALSVLGDIDLNTIGATGTYGQGSSLAATLAHHYPVVSAGILEVLAYNGVDFVAQRYTTYALDGNRVFTRGLYVGTWTQWSQVAKAGAIDAGTDITSGTLPVARGGTGATTTADALTALGAKASSWFPTWLEVIGKPVTFAPSAHGHAISDVSGLQGALDGKQPAGSYLVAPSGSTGRPVMDVTGANIMGLRWNGASPVLSVDASEMVLATLADVTSPSGQADGPTSTAYSRAATGSGWYATYMNSSLQFMRNTSSSRYKDAITPAEVDVSKVLDLEPVTFHRIAADDPDQRELGLIAEDCTDVPYLVQYENGQPEGVAYETTLPVLLLAVVKAQQAQLDALTARIAAVETNA